MTRALPSWLYGEDRMAGGISVHAVDVAHGRPAQGLQVEIFALAPERRLIAAGVLTAAGTLDHPVARGDGVAAGVHEVVFQVGRYLAATGAPAEAPFLDVVPFRFTIA